MGHSKLQEGGREASAVPRGLRFGKPVVVFLCFTRNCRLQEAEQVSDLLPRLTRCETPKRGASGCGPTLVVSSDYFERAAVSRNLGAARLLRQWGDGLGRLRSVRRLLYFAVDTHTRPRQVLSAQYVHTVWNWGLVMRPSEGQAT